MPFFFPEALAGRCNHDDPVEQVLYRKSNQRSSLERHIVQLQNHPRPGLRFENSQFVMIGLEVNGRPLVRAYSIASANYEEELEFFSIKVQNGPLTSRLQHLKVGDDLMVSRKPTGTLVLSDLKPGRNLYLFGTGTGLAPFMSLIKDPDAYERFEKSSCSMACVPSVKWHTTNSFRITCRKTNSLANTCKAS